MNFIQPIVLGIIQGLTEFLPVSSTAHLILAPYFLRWEDPGLAFDVALHMGTLAAVLLFFWKDWVDVLKQLFGKAQSDSDNVKWWQLIIGTLPGGIMGFLFAKQAEETLRNPL